MPGTLQLQVSDIVNPASVLFQHGSSTVFAFAILLLVRFASETPCEKGLSEYLLTTLTAAKSSTCVNVILSAVGQLSMRALQDDYLLPYMLNFARAVFIAIGYDAGERRWHVTVPLAISALALASMAHTMEHSPSLAFLSLLVATLAWAPNGIMYSYPATFLQGAAAATGVALINSIANVGGMIGPYLIGESGCNSTLVAIICLLCSALQLGLGHSQTVYVSEQLQAEQLQVGMRTTCMTCVQCKSSLYIPLALSAPTTMFVGAALLGNRVLCWCCRHIQAF